jgi:hypothetical protein
MEEDGYIVNRWDFRMVTHPRTDRAAELMYV